MKTKTSRADFRADNSGIVDQIKANGSKAKFKTVETGFTPSLSADDLMGVTVEGKIEQFEDWQNGRKKGTSLHLVNGGTKFRIPLYTTIENAFARHQGSKALDRKKMIGKLVRLTCTGRGKAKNGQSAPALFTVAVAI